MENTCQRELEVSLSQNFDVSADRLFVAWLDPYDLERFMSPAAGVQVAAVDNHPVEDGHFLIELEAEEQVLPHRGVYKSIERPKRLVFSWDSVFTDKNSEVEITVLPQGDEHSRIHLVHRGFSDEDSRFRHEQGWKFILKNLKEYLES